MEPGEARYPLSQLRRGALEYCVLGLLRSEQMYSYDLVSRLGADEVMVTSEGTLYPLLSRLRREGWVTTSWRESESGPPRRYYKITAAGHRALGAFIDDWRQFRDAVDCLLGMGERRGGRRA